MILSSENMFKVCNQDVGMIHPIQYICLPGEKVLILYNFYVMTEKSSVGIHEKSMLWYSSKKQQWWSPLLVKLKVKVAV